MQQSEESINVYKTIIRQILICGCGKWLLSMELKNKSKQGKQNIWREQRVRDSRKYKRTIDVVWGQSVNILWHQGEVEDNQR